MNELCKTLLKKYKACLIENTREGVWQYYECKELIKKFRDNCQSSTIQIQ